MKFVPSKWFVQRIFVGTTLISFSLYAESQEEVEAVEPSSSFIRTYLQPAGMPLVELFHKARESDTLNLHRTEAGSLESLADLFLLPSRYLFGGQNVDEHLQAKPAFVYDEWGWIATPISLVATPICAPIGYLLKTVSSWLPSTKRGYQEIREKRGAKKVVSSHEFCLKNGILSVFSSSQAHSLGFSRPDRLSETHQEELKALQEVVSLLDQEGIVYWLDCGSCLGAYRYGGMIPWDDDIDLSILANDHDSVKKILSTLDPEKYQIQDWSSYKHPKTFLKLYLKKTKTLIDIYHYHLDGETKRATYFYSYQDSALPKRWKRMEEVMTKPISYDLLFPLKKMKWDGVDVWVPADMEAFLHLKYGQTLTPTMVWDENKKIYLKVKNHPYWDLGKEA